MDDYTADAAVAGTTSEYAEKALEKEEPHMQYVRVEVAPGRAYTYGWLDEIHEPLEPGEMVTLPGNALHAEPFEGRVLRSLGEDPGYDGEIKDVLGRVEP